MASDANKKRYHTAQYLTNKERKLARHKPDSHDYPFCPRHVHQQMPRTMKDL
jgi:hypothetical protein